MFKESLFETWTKAQIENGLKADDVSLEQNPFARYTSTGLLQALAGTYKRNITKPKASGADIDTVLEAWHEEWIKFVYQRYNSSASKITDKPRVDFRAPRPDVLRALGDLYSTLSKRRHGTSIVDVVEIKIGPGYYSAADGEALVLLLDFFVDHCKFVIPFYTRKIEAVVVEESKVVVEESEGGS